MTVLITILALSMGVQSHNDKANSTSSRSNTQHNIAIQCVGPDKKPCSASQVADINHGISAGKRAHQALADVKSVTPSGTGGNLTCTQNNGQPCTAEQVQAVGDVANSLKCTINYNSSKSNTGN
ncbi:MAG TPA: hypothetical protein VJ723_09710 [Candidatus Angelobacter sp.]|nr:hypothetical protein [Candidatus Angelobacter sp.]